MARPKNAKLAQLDDAAFMEAYDKIGATTLASIMGVTRNVTLGRAHSIRNGPIKGVNRTREILGDYVPPERKYPQRYEIEVQNGTVIIFSDAHYWPGKASVAHRALVKMLHEKTPEALICNGDAVDMASASRHAPIGWEKRPTIQEEIEAAQDRLGEITSACTKRTRKSWNLGNHDARFETNIASKAPEYAKVAGIHLHDHFPGFERAWSTWINNSVVVKHRYKKRKSTLYAGKTMVTGHFHSARVEPHTDYNGTRFDVDTGCLANTYGDQFNYMEDNVRDWVSAFGILTFRKGQLLWPELVVAWDAQHVQYRGELIRV